jgi:hypothetical protein
MIHTRKVLFALLILMLFFLQSQTMGLPSGGTYPPRFTLKDGDWFDSWGFNRNYYGGSDGYMPNLAYETLGPERERAYSLGEEFKINYPDKVRRATTILRFVQQWTEYGYDSDNVIMEGVAQEEWAWNADEMVYMFNETMGIKAVGDCEDMAFLCGTIYIAAGIDVALVLAPQHVALLIWLPEYPNANYYWDIPDDGRAYGWIWVEATGKRNSVGWTPPDFADGDWDAIPLGFKEFRMEQIPQNPHAEDEVLVTAYIVSARASTVEVSLMYSTAIDFKKVEMQLEGTVYKGTIPKQPQGQKVQYYVTATDEDGMFFETEKVEYVVGQISIAPFLLELAIMVAIIILLVLTAFVVFKLKT